MGHETSNDSPRKVYLKDGLYVASIGANDDDSIIISEIGEDAFDQVIPATEGELMAFTRCYTSSETKEEEREAAKKCFKALAEA